MKVVHPISAVPEAEKNNAAINDVYPIGVVPPANPETEQNNAKPQNKTEKPHQVVNTKGQAATAASKDIIIATIQAHIATLCALVGQPVLQDAGLQNLDPVFDAPSRILSTHRRVATRRINDGLSAADPRSFGSTTATIDLLHKPAGFSIVGGDAVDGSLILSMERTLYAALNQAWLLVMCGIGFMSIGDANDKIPDYLGFFVILAALTYAIGSYLVHIFRLRAFAHGQALTGVVTVLWTGLLVGVVTFALLCELKYSLQYPYLSRAKAVELLNANVTIN